jgi:RNA polymerase sigma factor (sigma-70 family)
MSMNDDLGLIERAQQGDEKAMARLLTENRAFVAYICQRYLRHAPEHAHDDIIAAGLMGLVIAIRDFDQSRGVKLSTYAWHRIRAEARVAAIELQNVVTYRVQRERGSQRQFGPRHSSLDAPIRADSDMTFVDVLPDDDALSGDDAAMAAQLRDYIAMLPPKRRDVIRIVFGEDQNFQAVGDRLGISRERARQIYESALAMLRARYADRAVEYDHRVE